MKLKIAAIVPMRHSSERVPGKNYRDFAGQPLYRRIISTLLACPEISEVMIDTDSDWILDDAKSVFPFVKLYKRPEHLRDGMISMNDVLINSIEQIEADYYLQTHSTNPLLSEKTISAAIQAFALELPEHDSLFSVTRLQTRLWDSATVPINHDPDELIRTQDLEPVFVENSCLYLFSKFSLKENGHRIGARPMMFEIDQMEAQDIDEEQDFLLAEALFRGLEQNGTD
jgi:CMP-N-acetylneuraminic acid synthetase